MRLFRISPMLLFTFGLVLQPGLAKAQSAPQPTSTTSPAKTHALAIPAEEPSDEAQEESIAAKGLSGRVAAMLLRCEYDEIDHLAQKLRSEKTRTAGGGWELSYLYRGLKAPDRFHPEDHIARLNAWITARPQSITPRVALAGVYLKYAWAARGAGYADSVTPEGWRLFAERAAQAKLVLDDAAKLTPMCPEWFSKMQTVALAQDWEKDQTAALFQRAIEFEPEYIYFYKSYALYLLPKWDGNERDDADFARKSADAVGGKKGDYIYYEIGMVVLGAKSGEKGGGLDWARLQRGYQAQADLFAKNTNYDKNQFARMAFRFHDRTIGKQAFADVGEKWSKDVWKKREKFEQARKWADGASESTTASLH